MQTWQIAPRDVAHSGVTSSLTRMIGAIGDASFAHTALSGMNSSLHAASWSVYRVWKDRAPVLHLSSSHGVHDTTRDCFQVYRDGLYRRDRTFDAAQHGRLMLRLRADDIPNLDHRQAIYTRHRMVERLSVAEPQDDGSVLAVNLYHHDHQGSFEAHELDSFEHLSVGLMACVRRHIELTGDAPAPARPSLAELRTRLHRRYEQMPPRELDVCARLLQGLSYDGIAAELNLSVATVKTYRRRAFERMGMHFKSELFARFMGSN